MNELLISAQVPSATLEGSLPQLIPAARKPVGGARSADLIDIADGAKGATNPCLSVTRQSITDLLDAIEAARERAEANTAVNGEAVPEAVYPVAATYALSHLTNAHGWMDRLLLWLNSNGLFEQPDDQVSNTSAAYNVYGYCREAVVQLHHGRTGRPSTPPGIRPGERPGRHWSASSGRLRP